MSRREAWLSAGLVFGVALVVRAVAASQITFPRPEDVAYYVGVARNLLEGRGLTIDAIWSYATPPLAFDPPRPAFELWLPLPTFVMAIPMAILGSSFGAAQVASVLEGSVVAVLAWRLAADVAAERSLPAGRARWLALGTGLAVAVYLPLVLASVQPDSTMPFALLVLAAVLVMRRVLGVARASLPAARAAPRLKFSRKPPSRKAPRAGAPSGIGVSVPSAPTLDRALVRLLVALGVLLGLAALTRNEAIWLALTWALVAWWATAPAGSLGARARAALPLIGIPAVVSIAVYAPWAIRDWAAFGTPLPGQAVSNALLLSHRDVFAWADPPTLDRYLAIGPLALVAQRIEAFLHDLGSVLLLLGVPVSAIGLLALPWTGRGEVLRPLLVFSVIAFLVVTLVFPVATLAGTFLHGAGAIHVLVLLSALLALDGIVERVREWRSWTNPVAWIGPALAIAGSALLLAALLPGDAAAARSLAARYAAFPSALAAAGAPLPSDGSPVIADFPIWLATQDGVRAIALPDEPPAQVLDLARTFGAKLLIVDSRNDGSWPEILDPEEPGAECFRLVSLPDSDPGGPLDGFLAFQIVCTAPPSGPGQP